MTYRSPTSYFHGITLGRAQTALTPTGKGSTIRASVRDRADPTDHMNLELAWLTSRLRKVKMLRTYDFTRALLVYPNWHPVNPLNEFHPTTLNHRFLNDLTTESLIKLACRIIPQDRNLHRLIF